MLGLEEPVSSKMFEDKPGLGVVVGRWQVHDLHDGHRFIIQHALHHQKSLAIIGIHPALITIDNPLDYAAREAMLKAEYPHLITAPLKDCPTDKQWSRHLDRLIREIQPLGPVTIYGGRDSFIPHYKGEFQTREIDFISKISGTSLRSSMAHKVIPHPHFRAGMNYAVNNMYRGPILCVDIAILRPAKWTNDPVRITHEWEVLVGMKHERPDHWRFPGGHVDNIDESPHHAALREAHEETGLEVEKPLEFITSLKVKDWRDTVETTHFTNFYVTKVIHGYQKAATDLDGLRWIPLTEDTFESIKWADDHKKLAYALLTWDKEKRCSTQTESIKIST